MHEILTFGVEVGAPEMTLLYSSWRQYTILAEVKHARPAASCRRSQRRWKQHLRSLGPRRTDGRHGCQRTRHAQATCRKAVVALSQYMHNCRTCTDSVPMVVISRAIIR